jgi:hypothetical protein
VFVAAPFFFDGPKLPWSAAALFLFEEVLQEAVFIIL